MNGDHGDLPTEIELGDDDVVESIEVVEVEKVSGRDGVGTRREARERALALLFEAEQRGLVPLASILDHVEVVPDGYALDLINGVSDFQDQIDNEIRSRAEGGWPLERMPAIDRALLRLGVFELDHTEVPTGAVISEAVVLAKRYSTDDSHRFVNGLLSKLARDRGR